jgi:hypothetical protein
MDSCGVADRSTTILSGMMEKVVQRDASVGESAKLGPTVVTAGTWIINLLLLVAGGRYDSDCAIAASPAGVVYAVRTAPFTTS